MSRFLIERTSLIVASVRAVALVLVIAAGAFVAWLVLDEPVAHAITIVLASILTAVAIGSSAVAFAWVLLAARAAERIFGLSQQPGGADDRAPDHVPGQHHRAQEPDSAQ